MSNYTQQKFLWDRAGADWGRSPWPSLRTFPGWGIAPMLLGDRRPWFHDRFGITNAGSHVHCKSGNISETVQDSDAVATWDH